MNGMRRLRKTSTLLALLGLLLPWGRVMAVSAHLSIEDHEDAAEDHVAELAESFHGHSHPEGSPDHEHPWVASDAVAQKAKLTREIKAPALFQSAVMPTSTRAAGRVVGRQAMAPMENGPPGGPSRRDILRI